MRIVEKILAAAAGACACDWTGGLANRYLERTNTSLSMEIGSREALQNGEPITLGESGCSVQKRAVCAAERDR